MLEQVQAIETRYAGYRFRSRLEARYAVFFDAMKLEYIYEPEGFDLGELGYYLPDFYLPLFSIYAEVKPRLFTKEEFDKCSALPEHCLLLDGVPGVFRTYTLAGYEPFGATVTYEYYISGNLEGRILLSQSVRKGRLWYMWGESPDSYWLDDEPERKALSARFEFGETP